MSTPAGWYPDPWSQSPLRYWDGADWTSHVSGPPPGAFDQGAARNSLSKVSVWLQRYLIVEPLIVLLSFASTVSTFSGIREYLRQVRDDVGTADQSLLQPSGFARVGQLFGFLTLAGTVLRIMWMAQAGKQAEARGRPLRRSAVLAAFGWIIPIVNFWWPYHAMRDVLGPDRSKTHRASLWWLAYLITTLGSIVALITAFFSTPVAWLMFVIVLAARCAQAALEYRMVGEAVGTTESSLF
jgi:hypothetical protein